MLSRTADEKNWPIVQEVGASGDYVTCGSSVIHAELRASLDWCSVCGLAELRASPVVGKLGTLAVLANRLGRSFQIFQSGPVHIWGYTPELCEWEDLSL